MNLVETPFVRLPGAAALAAEPWALPRWWADAQLLLKPRISLMVLLTVAVGFLIEASSPIPWLPLVHALLGTAAVATAANILNQVLERDSDARMERTRQRPVAAGRMSAASATWLGMLTGAAGLAYLAVTANPLTVAVAAVTLASYVLIYTPLKRHTAWNTVVGAVPGALPPLIGCAAATGTLTLGGGALFLILFLWQFPHFWAIAWMYRADYARGGLVMLPNVDRSEGRLTGRLMFKTALWLLLVSLLPTMFGTAGPIYLVGTVLAGLAFVAATASFWMRPAQETARRTLHMSLIYLPVVLLLLLADGPLRWRM
ncbi:MAG TPA: heme o synthase [Gemmatales bacterium]|nr:heme o synthase [Gemmatales bacterium]HMP59713.1 heme o synthase [Gemmatales bacterium]